MTRWLLRIALFSAAFLGVLAIAAWLALPPLVAMALHRGMQFGQTQVRAKGAVLTWQRGLRADSVVVRLPGMEIRASELWLLHGLGAVGKRSRFPLRLEARRLELTAENGAGGDPDSGKRLFDSLPFPEFELPIRFAVDLGRLVWKAGPAGDSTVLEEIFLAARGPRRIDLQIRSLPTPPGRRLEGKSPSLWLRADWEGDSLRVAANLRALEDSARLRLAAPRHNLLAARGQLGARIASSAPYAAAWIKGEEGDAVVAGTGPQVRRFELDATLALDSVVAVDLDVDAQLVGLDEVAAPGGRGMTGHRLRIEARHGPEGGTWELALAGLDHPGTQGSDAAAATKGRRPPTGSAAAGGQERGPADGAAAIGAHLSGAWELPSRHNLLNRPGAVDSIRLWGKGEASLDFRGGDGPASLQVYIQRLLAGGPEAALEVSTPSGSRLQAEWRRGGAKRKTQATARGAKDEPAGPGKTAPAAARSSFQLRVASGEEWIRILAGREFIARGLRVDGEVQGGGLRLELVSGPLEGLGLRADSLHITAARRDTGRLTWDLLVLGGGERLRGEGSLSSTPMGWEIGEAKLVVGRGTLWARAFLGGERGEALPGGIRDFGLECRNLNLAHLASVLVEVSPGLSLPLEGSLSFQPRPGFAGRMVLGPLAPGDSSLLQSADLVILGQGEVLLLEGRADPNLAGHPSLSIDGRIAGLRGWQPKASLGLRMGDLRATVEASLEAPSTVRAGLEAAGGYALGEAGRLDEVAIALGLRWNTRESFLDSLRIERGAIACRYQNAFMPPTRFGARVAKTAGEIALEELHVVNSRGDTLMGRAGFSSAPAPSVQARLWGTGFEFALSDSRRVLLLDPQVEYHFDSTGQWLRARLPRLQAAWDAQGWSALAHLRAGSVHWVAGGGASGQTPPRLSVRAALDSSDFTLREGGSGEGKPAEAAPGPSGSRPDGGSGRQPKESAPEATQKSTDGRGGTPPLQLDLHLVAARDANRVHTPWGGLTYGADLHLTGDNERPLLWGWFESQRGEVRWQDRELALTTLSLKSDSTPPYRGALRVELQAKGGDRAPPLSLACAWDSSAVRIDPLVVATDTSRLSLKARLDLKGLYPSGGGDWTFDRLMDLEIAAEAFTLADLAGEWGMDLPIRIGEMDGRLVYRRNRGISGALAFAGISGESLPFASASLSLRGRGDSLMVHAGTRARTGDLFNDTLRLSLWDLWTSNPRFEGRVQVGPSLYLDLDGALPLWRGMRAGLRARGALMLPGDAGSLREVELALSGSLEFADPAGTLEIPPGRLSAKYYAPKIGGQSLSLGVRAEEGTLWLDSLVVVNPEGGVLRGEGRAGLVAGAGIRARLAGDGFAVQWGRGRRARLSGVEVNIQRDSADWRADLKLGEVAVDYRNLPLDAHFILAEVETRYRPGSPPQLEGKAFLDSSLTVYSLKNFSTLQAVLRDFRKTGDKPESPRAGESGPPIDLDWKLETRGIGNRVQTDFLDLGFLVNLEIGGNSASPLLLGEVRSQGGTLRMGGGPMTLERLHVSWNRQMPRLGEAELRAHKRLAKSCRGGETDSCRVFYDFKGPLDDLQFTYETDCGSQGRDDAAVSALVLSVRRGCYSSQLAGGAGGQYGGQVLSLLEPTLNYEIEKLFEKIPTGVVEKVSVSGLAALAGDSATQAIFLELTSYEKLRTRLRVSAGYRPENSNLSHPWELRAAGQLRLPADRLVHSSQWKRRLDDELLFEASVETGAEADAAGAVEKTKRRVGLVYSLDFWRFFE